MAGKQAKVLSDTEVNDLLAFAGRSRNPTRNEVIVLLSAKAGLRAGEIANLTWDMVLDPRGLVGFALELHNNAAKNGSGRVIPVHADLRRALVAWREISTNSGPIIRSERGGPMTALSIVVWFNRVFRTIGLKGCSSHSGRRTFITRAARLATVSPFRASGSCCNLYPARNKRWISNQRSAPSTLSVSLFRAVSGRSRLCGRTTGARILNGLERAKAVGTYGHHNGVSVFRFRLHDKRFRHDLHVAKSGILQIRF